MICALVFRFNTTPQRDGQRNRNGTTWPKHRRRCWPMDCCVVVSCWHLLMTSSIDVMSFHEKSPTGLVAVVLGHVVLVVMKRLPVGSLQMTGSFLALPQSIWDPPPTSLRPPGSSVLGCRKLVGGGSQMDCGSARKDPVICSEPTGNRFTYVQYLKGQVTIEH